MIKVDHILGPTRFVQNIFRAQFMSASNIKLISSVLIRQFSIRYPIIAQNYAKFENRQQYIPFYSLDKICIAGCNAFYANLRFQQLLWKGKHHMDIGGSSVEVVGRWKWSLLCSLATLHKRLCCQSRQNIQPTSLLINCLHTTKHVQYQEKQ